MSPSHPAAELEPGQLFEDRYRLEALVGRGGYAHVWRATQLELGRAVAIKILSVPAKDPAHRQELAARFRREAQVLSQLRDPHTLTIHDTGRTEDGALYLISEFVEGCTLEELVARQGALAPERVAALLRQLLESLDEAHRAGILHRDIKPTNVMLHEHNGRPDQVKLLDFGVARLLGDQEQALTRPGIALGTIHFMAPEHLTGRPLTTASDMYSVGVLAYELLTGERAFVGEPDEIARAKQSRQPLRLPEERALPAELRALVEALLDREPGRRPSAHEAIARIKRLEATAPAAPTAPASGASSRGRGALLALPVALALGVGLLWWWPRPEPAAGPAVMRVETEPPGVPILIEGQEVGRSPVLVSLRGRSFPLRVTADLYPSPLVRQVRAPRKRFRLIIPETHLRAQRELEADAPDAGAPDATSSP